MMGTINCVYETPCGWCSKWDKKCNKKTPKRGQRIKCNPIDDAAYIPNENEVKRNCHKCVYEVGCHGNPVGCKRYKRDAPDGGYYG